MEDSIIVTKGLTKLRNIDFNVKSIPKNFGCGVYKEIWIQY